MSGYRNIAGTWKVITPWRNIAGVWKAGVLWRNIAGTWKLVAGQLTVDVSPATVNGNPNGGGSPSPQTVTTSAATATPSQGSGSYTYSWTRDSGGAIAANCTSPTAASTTFSKSLLTDQSVSDVWRCTVTDTVTGQTAFDTVNVQFNNNAV